LYLLLCYLPPPSALLNLQSHRILASSRYMQRGSPISNKSHLPHSNCPPAFLIHTLTALFSANRDPAPPPRSRHKSLSPHSLGGPPPCRTRQIINIRWLCSAPLSPFFKIFCQKFFCKFCIFISQKFPVFVKIEKCLGTLRPLFSKIEKTLFLCEKSTFCNFYFFVRMYLILVNFRQILRIFESKLKKLGTVFPTYFIQFHVLHRGRPPRRSSFN